MSPSPSGGTSVPSGGSIGGAPSGGVSSTGARFFSSLAGGSSMSFWLFFHESRSPPTLKTTLTEGETTLKIGLYRISVLRTSYRTMLMYRS